MQLRICLIGTMMLAMSAGLCAGQTGVADQQRQAALALEQRGENVEAEAAWHAYLKCIHQVLRRTPTLASWKRARSATRTPCLSTGERWISIPEFQVCA